MHTAMATRFLTSVSVCRRRCRIGATSAADFADDPSGAGPDQRHRLLAVGCLGASARGERITPSHFYKRSGGAMFDREDRDIDFLRRDGAEAVLETTLFPVGEIWLHRSECVEVLRFD